MRCTCPLFAGRKKVEVTDLDSYPLSVVHHPGPERNERASSLGMKGRRITDCLHVTDAAT